MYCLGVGFADMENNEHTLEFNLEEYLLMGISIHQLDDGTTFYWNNNSTSSKRLYAKKNGKEIVAELPGEKCDCLGAYGDAIILRSNGKIYKAFIALPDKCAASYASMFYNMFFPQSERIEVRYVRDILKDENVNRNGTSSRAIGDKECVYRVGDNPECDWLLIEAAQKNLSQNLKLTCIHRDRAVYISYKSSKMRPFVLELGKNAIAVEIFHSSSNHINVFANDSSPFIYIAQDTILHTIDTDTMQFLPDLQTNRVSIVSITGVQDRVITAQCGWDFDYFIATAQLPRGYYKNVAMIDELKANMQEMSKRTDEIERKLKDVCERNRELEMKDRQNEMIKSDLLHTIEELRMQTSIVSPERSETLVSISSFPVPADPVMTPPAAPPLSPDLNSLARKPSPSPPAAAHTPERPSALPAGNDARSSLLDELRKRQELRKMREADALLKPASSPATPSPATVQAGTSSPTRRFPPPVPPKPSRIPRSPTKVATPVLHNAPIVPTGERLDSQTEDGPYSQIGQKTGQNLGEDELPPPPALFESSSIAEKGVISSHSVVAPPVAPPPPPLPPPPPPIVSPTSSSADQSSDARSCLLEEIRGGRRLKRTTPGGRRNVFEEQLREQFENLYPRDEAEEEEEEPENDSWINESAH